MGTRYQCEAGSVPSPSEEIPGVNESEEVNVADFRYKIEKGNGLISSLRSINY